GKAVAAGRAKLATTPVVVERAPAQHRMGGSAASGAADPLQSDFFDQDRPERPAGGGRPR
ncbi:MAG: hypothetical protein ACRDYD_14055, partial [Acidimicrobiales bacterium]